MDHGAVVAQVGTAQLVLFMSHHVNSVVVDCLFLTGSISIIGNPTTLLFGHCYLRK